MKEVVEPRIRGFVCLNAHPEGCAVEVGRQVEIARSSSQPANARPGGGLLVVGASAGYGLASRIAGSFGHGMPSVGVFYERAATDKRTASAGWYNTAALTQLAREAGIATANINGDAFSTEVLGAGLEAVRETLGKADVVVYSVAAPRRRDPDTGIVYESVLKTVGQPFNLKTIDLRTEEVRDAMIEPASAADVDGTVATMGGADLARWIDALQAAGALNQGARVVAYSYIGPEVTWPIYKDGTIGQAKADLERTVRDLDARLRREIGGRCFVSINKSVVTQASSAIPGVPLYMSLLFRVMKNAGVHEGPIEQMVRLFGEHIGSGRSATTDAEGRIRLDDREMNPAIQAETQALWARVNTDNLREISDYAGFQRYFHRLFGFDCPGVDYSEPVETDVPIPGVVDLT